MESNERFYARRAVEELRAAARAVTPEAQARRRALAEAFQVKAQAERMASSRPREPGCVPAEMASAMSMSAA